MKFTLASYGSRGDVEPTAAVGRELLRRGHEVHLAVPPDLVSFAESVGLNAVGYGLDSRLTMDVYGKFFSVVFRKFWSIHDLASATRELWEPVRQCWEDMNNTLVSLADGADVLFTGLSYQEAAANVAEFYDIPLATLHYFPVRPNGRLIPTLPRPLVRYGMRTNDWLSWQATRRVEDAQRRNLGLARATQSSARRVEGRNTLEIQAYDAVSFPGLATEWSRWEHQRPFVGALTLELPTASDDEVSSWVASGTPPIYFGFGSTPINSPADTVAMIGEACAHLGERALIGAGWNDLSGVAPADHVKVVSSVNFAQTFPYCRALVHHGGAGTTAAGLRAGVPTLVLWMFPEQSYWGAQLKRMRVGYSRRFSATTLATLVADIRTITSPAYVERARELALRMTAPADSVVRAADLVEDLARRRRVS